MIWTLALVAIGSLLVLRSAASDYLENALLNSLFNKTSALGALASPPTIRVALLTQAASDSDTGSTIVECNYTGYARVSTNAASWNQASGGAITNAVELAFAACTGGSSTATHFALVDATSGGNLLFHGTLSTPLAISNGVTPKFPVGALSISAN